MRGAARSLLVTPWFAAGTGFVIAAGLWIYSPHTVLRFPASAPATVPCLGRTCGPLSGPGAGQLAVSTPGKRFKLSRRGQPDALGQHRGAQAVTVDFTIIWQQDGKFGALITLSGGHVPYDWKLSFEMPGSQIDSVFGASWQTSPSGDGGTASPDSQPHFDHGDGADAVNFMITGSGSAATPVSCVLDGASCAFS